MGAFNHRTWYIFQPKNRGKVGLMDTIIFIVGVVVMMMVIGGCYLSMMMTFTSAAQKDNKDKL